MTDCGRLEVGSGGRPTAAPTGLRQELDPAEIESPGPDETLALEISELERLDLERRDLKARIQHSQKLESLGVLSGAVAHDFNNFLTGILGNAGMVLRRLPDDSDCRPLVEEIEKAAQHAAALSNQMLAYTGRDAAVSQPFDLKSLIEEMAPLLRISVSKKAVLRLELADDLPAVEGDPSQIRRVIMNLITNASDALGGESGYLSLAIGLLVADRGYLAQTEGGEDLVEGPYVFLEVSDTGSGLEGLTLAELSDPTFTTKGPGRGLGLAAVQGIVRDHGGAIKLDTVLGRGTTFKVLLTASDQTPTRRPREQEREGSWQGRGKVLVVDDEEIIREVARNILEDCGYEVLIAKDGRHALQVFSAQASEITAVLLDLTMPELNGAEAFVEMRQIRPDIRVVLSSGFDDNDSMIERFMTEESVGFLKKPYRPAELIERIRAVLRAP